jgi:hypothetical protein
MLKKIDKKKSAAAKKAWATRRENAGKKNNSPKKKKEIFFDVTIKKSALTLQNELIDLKREKQEFIVDIDKKIDLALREIQRYHIFIEQEKIILSQS